MTGPSRRLDVGEREQGVFRMLRGLADPDRGATVPAIHRHMTETGSKIPGAAEPARDTVTLPVYYKLARRLVSTGHLTEVPGDDDDPGGQRYALAPHLHADTALTLDDISDLAHMPPSEALATLVDAREYVTSRRDEVLRGAARTLRTVDPRALVMEMIQSKIGCYNDDLALYVAAGEDDDRHLRRLKTARAELEQICYRWFGLSHEAVEIRPAAAGRHTPIVARHDVLATQLARRVYGRTAIIRVGTDNPHDPQDWHNVVVSGSDGSTYSSAMQVDTAAAFVDDTGSEYVTFNNSVVYVRMLGELARRHPSPWYSVPLTRSAIDSPNNAGMVMAPFMYRHEGLNDGEYEHMAKCATDVVQWRADEEVFLGHARALGGSGLLPPPQVHLRDGTVTLQERESHHYTRTDSYGEMVREGVRLSHDVLRHIRDRRTPPVFAGAVKSSQIHLFATIVNWFVAHGHPACGVPPVDPGWDVSRASLLADNEAMTMLLGTLNGERHGGWFTSFVVVRPFHSLTDMYRFHEQERDGYWIDMFQGRQDKARADPMSDSYWKTVPDVADDPYVRMMELADYAMFYVGHSDGDPQPLAPRYEFLDALRRLTPEQAEQRVERNVGLLVAALRETGLSIDLDHNFMSRKRLVKLVPYVVYEAHEKCKSLGRQLESELKSMVIANLQYLQRARVGPQPEVRFRPMPVRAYIERYRRARQEQAALPDGDGDVDVDEQR